MTSDLVKLIYSSGNAVTAQTKELYANHVRKFVQFCGKSKPTGMIVETWRDELSRQGLSPQTVNNHLAGVKFASKRLAQLNQNPQLDFARYAQPLKERDPKRRTALTIDDVKKMLRGCSGSSPIDLRDKVMIVVATRTALRRGGLCALCIEDLKGRVLHIHLKGETERDIVLDDEAVEAFQEWIGYLRKQKITNGPLFRDLRPSLKGAIGGALSGAGVYAIIRRRAEAAGIKAFPHLFRHTAVSMLSEKGEPTWRIQRLTGQKSAAVIDRYRTDYEETSRPVGSSIPSLKEEKP